MLLIDTHTHLQFPDFEKDIDQIIFRANTAGVKILINVGSDLAASRKAVEMAERYENAFAAVGIHPHDAKEFSEASFAEIERMAEHPKVVAIGEIGLDYYRNLSSQQIQKEVVVRFLELAKKKNLPIVLHIRDAYPEMIAILKENCEQPVKGVCHCFSGTRSHAEEMLRLGLYISFSGPVTYKKNDELREIAKMCPNDRILIETDAPYLPPEGFRGKRNEPAFLLKTAQCISELKQMPLEAFANTTAQNAIRVFGLPPNIEDDRRGISE